ncbi:hypothetical protein [Psittacicella gerlachiana]|uniref:Uncharacterized protein n=1 Tax=Psittacicella gerlachiana TaxID=2028574 RepID=A0A3A1YD71_9GAMM|nr:hypothetical protein [Psittacicella gerlachiana]RIY36193.1 hypothetical protein CKF59_02890 [Psittacicella gerlachiana]
MQIKSFLTTVLLGATVCLGNIQLVRAADLEATDRIPSTQQLAQQNVKAQAVLNQVNLVVSGKLYADNTVTITTNAYGKLINSYVLENGVKVFTSIDVTAKQINAILEDLQVEGRVTQAQVKEANPAIYDLRNSLFGQDYIRTYLKPDTRPY